MAKRAPADTSAEPPNITTIRDDEAERFPPGLGPWARETYAALFSEYMATHGHRPGPADALILSAAVHEMQSAMKLRHMAEAAAAEGDDERFGKLSGLAVRQEAGASIRLVNIALGTGATGTKKAKRVAAKHAAALPEASKWAGL